MADETERKLAVLVGAMRPSETFIRREIDGLRRLGWTVHVFALEDGQQDHDVTVLPPPASLGMITEAVASVVRRDASGLGIDVPTPGSRDWLALRLNVARARWLVKALKAEGIGRLHCHFLSTPATVGMIVAAGSDIAVSLSAHARDVFVPEDAWTARKVAAARFTTVCNSAAHEAVLDCLTEKSHKRKVHLLHHGTDMPPEPPRPTPADGPVMAAGRLVEKKGFVHLVEALAVLKDRGRTVRAVIAGSGPLEAQLRKTADCLGVADRVDWCGWLPGEEIAGRLAHSAACIVPSVVAADGDRDGVANIVLEAFAAGCPVAASAVGGLPDAVEHQRSGLLVSPGDARGLADAIERLLDDDALRKTLVRGAHNRLADRFAADRTLEALSALLN